MGGDIWVLYQSIKLWVTTSVGIWESGRYVCDVWNNLGDSENKRTVLLKFTGGIVQRDSQCQGETVLLKASLGFDGEELWVNIWDKRDILTRQIWDTSIRNFDWD